MVDPQEEIQICSQNIEKSIEKMNMEISQLQKIKFQLMSRKKQLVDEISRTKTKLLIEDMDRDTKKIYDKVLPLVSEIHSLELRSLEFKEQIHLTNMEHEANALVSTLTEGCCRKKGILTRWFKELKALNTSGSAVNNPRYQVITLKSGAQKEELDFTVFHCGISVTVQMNLTRQMDSSDFSSDSVEVFSDIFIPDLLQTVQSNMLENSILVVVESITQYIAEEITLQTDITCEIHKNANESSKS